MRDINVIRTSRGDFYHTPRNERETCISFFDDEMPSFTVDTCNQALADYLMDYHEKHPDIVEVIRDKPNWSVCFRVKDNRLIKGGFRLREPMSEDEKKRRIEQLNKINADSKTAPNFEDFPE